MLTYEYVCTLCVYQASEEARQGHHIPWKLGYGWFRAYVKALGTNPRSSAGSVRTLNC